MRTDAFGRLAGRRYVYALIIGFNCVMMVMTAKRTATRRDKSKGDCLHRRSVVALQDADIPFLIGGAYVVEIYAGVSRRTKDFDLYLRPQHVDLALDALKRAGYKTEKTFPHWLAKAARSRDCVDLIFRAGNGLCEVDDSWFERAHSSDFLDLQVKLCAPEEMIWMKAYIMERERFDGADVAHILQSCAEKLNWAHLVRRFGSDWRVLLSHLVLFGYIYPGERDKIPPAIMDDLISRLRSEKRNAGADRVCRGTLLSRKQYLLDIQERRFRDARLEARVHMDAKDIAHWTKAIAKEERARRTQSL
ncbi:MAG TPA: nucleotidyltransferase [Candidatus Udaeobacter sp.]|nr:nucleotidyltransferase [Candidatus Udaeobacter sp.]